MAACRSVCRAAIWLERDELLLTAEGWGVWWSPAPSGSERVLPGASPRLCSSFPLCPLPPSSADSFCLSPILSPPSLPRDTNFSQNSLFFLPGNSLPETKTEIWTWTLLLRCNFQHPSGFFHSHTDPAAWSAAGPHKDWEKQWQTDSCLVNWAASVMWIKQCIPFLRQLRSLTQQSVSFPAMLPIKLSPRRRTWHRKF